MTAPGPHLGDALSGLVDGELAEGERRAAQDHIESCAVCTAELAGTNGVRLLVRALPMLSPPVPLWVPARLPAGRRWAAPAAAAAAAVAMALLATVGGTAEPTPAPLGRLVQVHATSAVNADPVSQLAPAAIPVSFDAGRP